jgi:hypothetical protein
MSDLPQPAKHIEKVKSLLDPCHPLDSSGRMSLIASAVRLVEEL